MTVSSVNPFESQVPDTGTVYGNIMNALFGTMSEAEQQSIWVGFLQSINLPVNTPVVSVPDDAGTQEDFLLYIQKTLADSQLLFPIDTSTALSPDEIKKRNIMFAVFNSCVSMLLSLQNTVTTQATNLQFFTNWQEQLTDQLTAVPTYVGGENSAVHVDLSNLNEFTFGYDNISVADIANWWAAQVAPGGPGNTFSIGFTGQDPGFGLFFTPTSISVNFGAIQYFVTLTPGQTTAQSVANFEKTFVDFWNGTAPVIRSFGGVGPLPLPALLTDFILPVEQVAQNTLNNIASTNVLNLDPSTTTQPGAGQLVQAQIFGQSTTPNTDPYAGIEILKPYTYISSPNITQTTDPHYNLSSSNAKSRAEINSRDQQFIQNITSARQQVQNVSQDVQTNLNQSQQELSQQTDLITAIVTSLQGLIASIFR